MLDVLYSKSISDLSELKTMSLLQIRLFDLSHFDCKTDKCALIALEKRDNLLFPAKLWSEALEEQKEKEKKNVKNILYRTGPGIDPCGAPNIVPSKSIFWLLIQRHCFQSFK